MEFGALFLGDPPFERVIELAKLAEDNGFDYVWTADSHILWMEAWIQYAIIARETTRVKIGPMVTNPGTRDPTVVASLLATLNEMSNGRAVCGIGRGDSARRTIGHKPVPVAAWESSIPLIRDLAEGKAVEYDGHEIKIEWASGYDCPMWGAAYGPKALSAVGRACDGFVLQLADPDVLQWCRRHVDTAAEETGRSSGDVKTMISAPPYILNDNGRDHAHAQLRWFAGSVANHVADMISTHGVDTLPGELTEYMQSRPDYDYKHHGKPNNPRTEYVPDYINDRFCVIGTADEHIAKLEHLASLGVDVFTGYMIHDNVEETIKAYGRHVIPHFK